MCFGLRIYKIVGSLRVSLKSVKTQVHFLSGSGLGGWSREFEWTGTYESIFGLTLSVFRLARMFTGFTWPPVSFSSGTGSLFRLTGAILSPQALHVDLPHFVWEI